MNLTDLIAWHRVEMAHAEKTSDPVGLVHEDAIALLEWCVELPATTPDQFAKSYAFETLLEQTAMEAKSAAVMRVTLCGSDDREAIDHEVRFWNRLNANVAEQLPA